MTLRRASRQEPHRGHEPPLGESQPPAGASSAVAVDIGEGAGALVVWSQAARAGLEVELQRADGWRTHVWVLPRKLADGVRHAGVFPSLEPGDYQVIGFAGARSHTVEILAGSVTETTWP